jgi:hypothetical protein
MSFRADGRVVEGRATLFRHHREVSRVRPRPDGPPMDVCLFLYMISLAIAAFTATLCISPVDILTVMTETQQKKIVFPGYYFGLYFLFNIFFL